MEEGPTKAEGVQTEPKLTARERFAKEKSTKAIIMILAALVIAVLLMGVGFIVGLASNNILLARIFFVSATFFALLTVLLNQFMKWWAMDEIREFLLVPTP